MLWFFLIFSTVCWGLAEIFYKKGNTAGEKYAHLKTTVFVGFFFGIYAIVILFTQDVSLKDLPANFIRYLPVAACYIISMICSYFGVRYIEESIADPIENTSCAFVPILCAVVLHEELTPLMIIAIVIVVIGILGAGLFDKEGRENRKKNFGKKLALVSIAMPFCYMILDAIGTFLDIYYTESAETSVLIGVTEENLEHTANCCYELTFLLVAIGILIFLKIKKVRIFDVPSDVDSNKRADRISDYSKWQVHVAETADADSEQIGLRKPKYSAWQRIYGQRNKIIAALFETGGQATYLFALSEGSGVAAVILGAGTVIISFILSRIILKEKLTPLQYTFIAAIFAGIIMLALI